ncbi:hypothetical protein BDN67DRAFT_1002356 [Paxillus ammoniavirescens]|nr:hypothetical protein BDN67DRAFT_1002356 [Paxillus ammoniavirescens]
MSLVMSKHTPAFHTHKRRRRTATSVLAGDFDQRPARDVLTSLLNGVGPYKEVEKEEEMRRARKRERKERDKERKKKAPVKAPEKKPSVESLSVTMSTPAPPPPPAPCQSVSAPVMQPSSFWRARGTSHRPTIHIATMQRSVSVTPPPMASSPRSTPGPSDWSTTSRTSSKRPRTPDDDEDALEPAVANSTPPPRKKRVAVKKGWKGWVEGSPPPSEKLINLDAVPILQERRTRSGKSFDAIGVGKDSWV